MGLKNKLKSLESSACIWNAELENIQNRLVAKLGFWGAFIAVSTATFFAIVLYLVVYYRQVIQRKIRRLEERLALGVVYRDTESSSSKIIRALELHPTLLASADNVMSLGEYLSSLRINPLEEDESSIPRLLERELEATIASTLLRNFGPRLGGVLLPVMGISKIDSWIAKVAGGIATYFASHILVEASEQWDPSEDRAVFPFSVPEIVTFVNINQKFRSRPLGIGEDSDDESDTSETDTTSDSPLAWMGRGEIGYSPTFASDVPDKDGSKTKYLDAPAMQDELLPNPFIMKYHFRAAIFGMESRIRSQSRVTDTNPGANAETATTTAAYRPDDRSLPKPIPVNERVLPGLHIGWGDAECTHTKREILRNRLMAVLMTKLSYNYSLLEKGADNLFVVNYNDVECRFPDEFISALMQDHTIEVCPRSTITTFGIAACVKEEEEWFNIPLAFFFRTGYEAKDGKPAYFSAPHGGLDLSIKSGPLLGQDERSRLDIQFYVAIEGMCGWHSNHNVDVSWLKPVSTTKIYDRAQTIQAVRLAGFLAVAFNSLSTEMGLPFGGYGVLGVCNDSAAFIDFALRGETNMYPLISTGRFVFHSARRLLALKNTLSTIPSVAKAAVDIDLLLKAACNLESDIHSSPSQLIGATKRYLSNYPESYFQMTDDSKRMMNTMSKTFQGFTKGTSNAEKTVLTSLFGNKNR